MNKLSLAFLSLLLALPLAFAQEYPIRPVKVIVPTTAGSAGDAAARHFADQLSALLGQPFVVENRPGADGVIGIMAVKGAPADGYTLLTGLMSPMVVNPVTKKDLPYDPVKDLQPIHGIVQGMTAFAVPADSKWTTLADLVAAAKSAQRPLSLATTFTGPRLDMEWFSGLAGVKFNHVPYKGSAEVINDLLGNHVDIAFIDRAVIGPLVKSGKLKALAVAGAARHADFPNVPTVRESGYPEFVSFGWNGFFVRSETPEAVQTKLAEAMSKAMASDATKAFAAKLGADLLPLGPAALRKHHLEQLERYRRLAKSAGIEPQ